MTAEDRGVRRNAGIPGNGAGTVHAVTDSLWRAVDARWDQGNILVCGDQKLDSVSTNTDGESLCVLRQRGPSAVPLTRMWHPSRI